MPDRNQKDLQEVPPAILANMEVISLSLLQILINPTKEPRHLYKSIGLSGGFYHAFYENLYILHYSQTHVSQVPSMFSEFLVHPWR